MTKTEFQAWWMAHLPRLTRTAEHDLLRIGCQDCEVAATGLLESLEAYLARVCERLQEDPWSLCCAAIRRRARNHIRNDIRKHGPHLAVPLEDADNVSYLMEGDTLIHQHVQRILSMMLPKDREILLLVIVEGWTIEEVSAKFGYAHRTGAMRAINTAKMRFRVLWLQAGYGEGNSPSSTTDNR